MIIHNVMADSHADRGGKHHAGPGTEEQARPVGQEAPGPGSAEDHRPLC